MNLHLLLFTASLQCLSLHAFASSNFGEPPASAQAQLPMASSHEIGRDQPDVLFAVTSALAPLFADPALRAASTTFAISIQADNRAIARIQLRGCDGHWEIDVFGVAEAPYARFGWLRKGGEVLVPLATPKVGEETERPSSVRFRGLEVYSFGGMYLAIDALRSCAYWNALPDLSPSAAGGEITTLDTSRLIAAALTREIGEIALYDPPVTDQASSVEWARSVDNGMRTYQMAWTAQGKVWAATAVEGAPMALCLGEKCTRYSLRAYMKGDYAWQVSKRIVFEQPALNDALASALSHARPECVEILSRVLSTKLQSNTTASVEAIHRALLALDEELQADVGRPMDSADMNALSSTLMFALQFEAGLLEQPLAAKARRERGVQTIAAIEQVVLKGAEPSRAALMAITGWSDAELSLRVLDASRPMTSRIGTALPSLYDEMDPQVLVDAVQQNATDSHWKRFLRLFQPGFGKPPDKQIRELWKMDCLIAGARTIFDVSVLIYKRFGKSTEDSPIAIALRQAGGKEILGNGSFGCMNPRLTVKSVAPCVMPASMRMHDPK